MRAVRHPDRLASCQEEEGVAPLLVSSPAVVGRDLDTCQIGSCPLRERGIRLLRDRHLLLGARRRRLVVDSVQVEKRLHLFRACLAARVELAARQFALIGLGEGDDLAHRADQRFLREVHEPMHLPVPRRLARGYQCMPDIRASARALLQRLHLGQLVDRLVRQRRHLLVRLAPFVLVHVVQRALAHLAPFLRSGVLLLEPLPLLVGGYVLCIRFARAVGLVPGVAYQTWHTSLAACSAEVYPLRVLFMPDDVSPVDPSFYSGYASVTEQGMQAHRLVRHAAGLGKECPGLVLA